MSDVKYKIFVGSDQSVAFDSGYVPEITPAFTMDRTDITCDTILRTMDETL